MHSLKSLALPIRFLSADAVEQAQSGHPGMPLGMADIATVLWQKFLRHNPKNPFWFNRDRFILSNGHGSMLLYALLHMTGYALTIEDLKQFRQLHSKTPGHPEVHHTPGVETTTGPLGQGLAHGVGMALTERLLAKRFNRDGLTLVDHTTYVFVGDGCLMEGISHEVCSLAGTLQLNKLIVFYDDNGISIDGRVEHWFTDDTKARFLAYHWHVQVIDGHDEKAIEEAIQHAKNEATKPSLIICKTIIGYGSKQAGSEHVHGAPLGADDISHLRAHFNWPHPPFEVPEDYYAQWDRTQLGGQEEQAWLMICHQYQKTHPEDYFEFLRRINGDLPDDFIDISNRFIEACKVKDANMATRKASQHCIEAFAKNLPELIGGSADLSGSNNTNWPDCVAIKAPLYQGNYLYYGVREFGMSAMLCGMALHGGVIPFAGTFLVFSDYARNAVRMSALMKQRVIFIYSHDSIGLGEDGPTHQPIEHIAMLRMTPNVKVWRPANLYETAIAWQCALSHHLGPSCILLSRQTLPALTTYNQNVELVKKGAYIIHPCEGAPDIILLATGSEVHLAIEAAEKGATLGIQCRVVSMPCVEQFLQSEPEYQEQVLPKAVRHRIAIEAGAAAFWYQLVGLDGLVIGLNHFGLSAPGPAVFEACGITIAAIVDAMTKLKQPDPTIILEKY